MSIGAPLTTKLELQAITTSQSIWDKAVVMSLILGDKLTSPPHQRQNYGHRPLAQRHGRAAEQKQSGTGNPGRLLCRVRSETIPWLSHLPRTDYPTRPSMKMPRRGNR